MSKKIHLLSPAKVNLTLDVLGKDPGGYHRIQTILHEVPTLFDELIFQLTENPLPRTNPTITLDCNHPDVPINETNTILRAAKLLQKKYHPQKGVHIILKKNIPLQSGLGGSSSNAATTLKGLNKLWELGIDDWTLRNDSAEIGMDVPFFITGGCAIGMHYGEQLEHLPTIDRFGYEIEVIPTNIQISTSEAYSSLDLTQCGQRNRDTGQLVELLKEKDRPTDSDEILSLLHNDFEPNFFHNHSKIRNKYSHAHLSGSGGSLYKIRKIAKIKGLA